jgi:hypothetical protein
MLCNKYLCSRHFLESVFTIAERVQLNRVTISCGLHSASQSLPQPLVPSLHTPSLDPLPSVIISEDNIHVVPPTTYKTLVPSAVTPIPKHADNQSFHFLSNVCCPTITNSTQ